MDEPADSARLRHLEGLATLASGLAHDFNNVLAAIRGTASLGRKRTGEGESAHALFADIERLVDNASRITSSLLQHARDDEYCIEEVDVDAFVAECSRDFGRGREGMPEVHHGPFEKLALVDRTKLHQVMLNLLHNANDATGDPEQISVRTHKRGKMVVVEVCDTGPGMDGDTVAQLFKPFFTTKPRGTGLGMVMSRAIVLALGGTMSVESVPNEGTVVSMHLPGVSPIRS